MLQPVQHACHRGNSHSHPVRCLGLSSTVAAPIANTIFWRSTFLSILEMQRCAGVRITWAHLWQGARHYLHLAEEKTKGGLGTYKLFSVEVNMDVGEMRTILMKSSLLHCTSTLISTPAAKLSFICRGLSWTEADVTLLTNNIRCSFSKQITFCSFFTFR